MSDQDKLIRLEKLVDQLLKKVDYLIDLYNESECLSENSMPESDQDEDMSPIAKRRQYGK